MKCFSRKVLYKGWRWEVTWKMIGYKVFNIIY